MARILYVEDESWQVASTVITFIEKGLRHQVVLVNSLQAAKEKLSVEHYDVVFLDIMLGVTRGPIEFSHSGLLIVQMIKEGAFTDAGNSTTLPVVIASGQWDMLIKDNNEARMTVEEKARALGVPQQYFLRKPFLDEEVRAVLKTILGDG